MDGGVELDKLAPALVALQADLRPVEKSADNPFFKSKYAPLPEVMKAAQPLLSKHKLAVSQFVTHLDGQSALRTILLHESGQRIEDIQPLLLSKQDPQGQGSAITYARRYGVMAVLGLVADDDDDGNAASQRQAPTAGKSASGRGADHEQQLNELAKRILALRLKDEATRHLVKAHTGKPSIKLCKPEDLKKLAAVLDRIESGEEELPDDWYAAGQGSSNGTAEGGDKED